MSEDLWTIADRGWSDDDKASDEPSRGRKVGREDGKKGSLWTEVGWGTQHDDGAWKYVEDRLTSMTTGALDDATWERGSEV